MKEIKAKCRRLEQYENSHLQDVISSIFALHGKSYMRTTFLLSVNLETDGGIRYFLFCSSDHINY